LKNEEHFSNSNRKLNITLIDQPSNLAKENFIYKENRIPDPRIISLTPASIRFLDSIGVWEKLDKNIIKFVKGMQIWESKGSSFVGLDVLDLQSFKNNAIINLFKSNNLLGKNDFFNLDFVDKVPNDYICALIEINHIVFHLQEMVRDRINIIKQSIQIDKIDIENTDEYCYLTINNTSGSDNTYSNNSGNNQKSESFRTKLLIASDGGNSLIRNKLKMQTTGYQYNETGLVCTLRGNKACDVAFQRFMHNGIFALLPLYDNLYSIVCSMPKNINEDLKRLDDQKFLQFINNVLHNPSEMDTSQLERLMRQNNYVQPPVIEEIVSKKFEFNLQLQYANNPVNKNVILIGDASHMVHPMAGQGLNLGIMDSAFLADEIIKALNSGRRLNDLRALQDFTFRSQLNTRVMIATIESLKTIYGPTNSVISAIRNLGMSLSNYSETIRGLFILSASGIPAQPNKFAWEKN